MVASGGAPLYARILSVRIRPEALPTAVEMFRGTSASIISAQPGFGGLISLVSNETGQTLTITLWTSQEARDASGLNSDFIRDLAGYGEYVVGALTRDTWDVAFASLDGMAIDDHDGAVATVTSVGLAPEHWHAALFTLQEIARNDARDAATLMGGLVLQNQLAGRAVIVEIARTRIALFEREPRARFRERQARRSGYVRGTLERDTFDIIAWRPAGAAS